MNPEPYVGEISMDAKSGLLVVWTGQRWAPSEDLTPDEYLNVVWMGNRPRRKEPAR